MHWNPWLANVSQVHQEPPTGHPNPYMEMFKEELCMQNLPENVKIVETHLPTGRHQGVFTGQRRIAKGTRFGPYTGNIVLPLEMRSPEKNSVWEVMYCVLHNEIAIIDPSVLLPTSLLSIYWYNLVPRVKSLRTRLQLIKISSKKSLVTLFWVILAAYKSFL